METPSNQTSKSHESQPDPNVGSGLAKDLKQQTGDIAEQAKAKARDAAHSGQTAAANQLEHLAQDVRRSVENFDDEQAWVKQSLTSTAESLERFSSTLRDRDLGDLLQDAEDVARRHPVVFTAACGLAGFAIVRFLKSSRSDMSYAGDADTVRNGARSGYGSMPRVDRSGNRQADDYTANI